MPDLRLYIFNTLRQRMLSGLLVVAIFLLPTHVHAKGVFFYASKHAIGIGAGVAHYFGDINPFFDAFRPGVSLSVFSRHAFNHYLAARVQLAYNHVGFSDALSDNSLRRLRNLSFQSDIYEASGQLDFHFLKYIPGRVGYNFTPYLTMGMGIFYFHSYTFVDGRKQALRPLQTEGVRYAPVSVSLPIGLGVKWGIGRDINMGVEVTYRFTATDYLDDVSDSYIGANTFSNPVARYLQDRSVDIRARNPLGQAGRQRGQSTAADAFVSLQIMCSFNIYRYQCPPAKLF